MAKEILSPDEYQNRLVDFYEQTLGSAGIQTTKPDEEEEDKKTEYVAPKIIDDGSDDDGDVNLFAGIGRDAGAKSKNIDSVLDFKTNNKTLDIMELNLPSSYSGLLEQNNRNNKSDLSAYEKTFANQVNKIQTNVNKNLQKNFKVGIDYPNVKQTQKYGLTSIVGNFLGADPFVTGLVGSAVAGKTETSIKGGQTFKPSGIPGIIQDVSQSLELEALRTNQTAYQKAVHEYDMGLGFDDERSDFNSYLNGKDIGFSFDVGNNNMTSIYRDAGSKIYNGAMYNVSQEQARRLEALGKGKNTYNFNPLNPNDSEDLVSTDNEGGYDEKGNFHDGRFGVSAVGRARNRNNLAMEIFGVSNRDTQNLTDKALSIARNQKGGLSKALKEQLNIYKPTTIARTQEDSGDGTGEGTTFTGDDYEGGVAQGADASDYDEGSIPDSMDAAAAGGADDFGLFKTGGRIGMQEGGNTTEVVQPAGFIAPDPNATDQQEIADDKPIDARDGDFIINAPAAEDAGKQDIQRMINTAIRNLQEKGVDVRFGDPKINIADKVKLLVSRNEVYIPSIIAKEIGYDRLKKINNRGKREVQRRQEESQQEEKPQARGFVEKKEGDVVEKKTINDVVYKTKYSSTKKARDATDEIIKTIPAADALALLMEGEAKNLGDEGLEGAAHVLINRTNASGYKNFGKSLFRELTAKYRGKKEKLFEFNAFEPTKFRESLNTFKNNEKRYLKVRNIAEEVLAGARKDFTNGALFFKNPTTSTEKNFKKQVDSGELQETARTVHPKFKKILHAYYKPKDFGTVETEQKRTTGFMEIPKNVPVESQIKTRIPEATGGSFLFRGSDYDTGGATPAF